MWVDRDDSLSVIYWVIEDIGKNKINSEEFISSVYGASKKVHDALRSNGQLSVTTIPNNAIKFAKWCYRKKGTCKKEKYCYNNIYSPLNRSLSVPNK